MASVQLLACALHAAGLVPGLVCFGLAAISSEFTFVSGLSWVSSGGVVAESVGTLIGLYFCLASLSGFVVSFIITPVFHNHGLLGVSAIAGGVMVAGVLALYVLVPPLDPTSSPEPTVATEEEPA